MFPSSTLAATPRLPHPDRATPFRAVPPESQKSQVRRRYSAQLYTPICLDKRTEMAQNIPHRYPLPWSQPSHPHPAIPDHQEMRAYSERELLSRVDKEVCS